MKITDDKSIRDLQNEFSQKFTNLRIKFYSQKHKDREGSPEKYELDHTSRIGDVRSVHNEGDISIHGNMKVSSLENEFEEKYGLNVQVFRRSRELWLQTTSTDDWTLNEQNAKGI